MAASSSAVAGGLGLERRAALDQKPRHVEMPVKSRDAQRRAAVERRGRIYLRSFVQEETRDLHVTVACRHEQRSCAVRIGHIHPRRIGPHKRVHASEIAPLCGAMKRIWRGTGRRLDGAQAGTSQSEEQKQHTRAALHQPHVRKGWRGRTCQKPLCNLAS